MTHTLITHQSSAFQALENLRMRLLDLTARNRLINFRHTKSASLRVIDEMPDQLVKTLLSGTEMRFAAVPEPTEEKLIEAGYLERNEETGEVVQLQNYPTAEAWAKQLGFDISYEVPKSSANNTNKHSDNIIQTLLYPYEMEVRLKSLLQKSESAIQEMGANILYLAFGFLEWHESNSGNSERLAPLFLLPVRLHKGRLNPDTSTYEYTLCYSDEDIISNLSLREKLRADFAIALPELDENTAPEDYFQKVQALIENQQPSWRLRRYITLTLLNFRKLLMYLDLDPARWPDDANIVNHSVISRFLCDYDPDKAEDDSPGDLGFGEEYPIDEMKDVHDKYPLIEDADSSQHSALIDAVDGKDLVIEGPPGTGKSQTITNLIAATMAQGKKVLFVAEKLAALEVVRRRLNANGLGEFCLELHSHKSQKRKVLDDVEVRLNKHGRYRKPQDIKADIEHYEGLKTELKNYVEKINRSWKNTGKTIHEIFMAATRHRIAIGMNPESFHPSGYDGSTYDATAQRRNEYQVSTYRKVYQAIAKQLGPNTPLQEHPWFGVQNTDLQIFDLERVKKSLSEWNAALEQLTSQREVIADVFMCDKSAVAETVSEIQDFLNDLENIPELKGDELLDRLPILCGELLEKTQHYLQLFEDIQERYASLSKLIPSDILADLSVAEELLAGSKQLKRLVNGGVLLHDLAEATNRLIRLEKQLRSVESLLHEVASALGHPGTKYLVLSESGLSEFKTVIAIITCLKPVYWKQRDDIFDNDELDELLPRLRQELEELRTLYDKIHKVFALDNIPDEEEIRRLATILACGGMFCWFKKSWREAREQLLRYAANPQVKLSAMLPLLEDLSTYSRKRQKLEDNTNYKRLLGEHLHGLDTDITALEVLREWYKRIRQQYGMGFGEKADLGDAILALTPCIARSVRYLSEQGLERQIDDLLKELNSLKEIFSPVGELHNTHILLIGNKGVIPRLVTQIKEATEACGSLVNDDSLSVDEINERIEQLELLRQEVEEWHKTDLDNELFLGQLALKPGIGLDNRVGLSRLRNTLDLAACLDGKLHNKIIVDHIYKNPTETTFVFLKNQSVKLKEAVDSEKSAYEHYAATVELDRDGWFYLSGDRLDALIARNKSAIDSGETLQSWLDYVREREGLEELGLNSLPDAVENFTIEISQVEEAYQAGVFDLLAREILHDDPDLARFSGHSQEAIQERFAEYDNKLKQLQCEQIAWKIDRNEIPNGSSGARVSELTELMLLKHECTKKKRHLPIRQLVDRAGNALVALKPCFMMGPMSVAQYLAPGKIKFDLVVMDEASQIKPQDALGVVARGDQLVVVGDPKQLPPTSFFDRIIDEEQEDLTGIEESESILDATLPMFSARRLRWHYRSQHQSLIAFSNQSFYNNDLVVFPSPHRETKNYGIQYLRIRRGCFVNRRNMEEAKIISEAVRDHFRHFPDESLGVVAMSSEQRLQIERAIETLAKEDYHFQGLLEKNSTEYESLFIKNLENVQGDERDVIFISMTYGPREPGGRVYQRFGPINSDVGWRRLNVLFTRAKKRMHVFSSMGSDDIIIGTSSKRGVKALRDFLAYCETGVLHETVHQTEREPDSDFEIAVMNMLRNEGFECTPQVGVAGFFIDIAVLDPGNSGRYLMGIECDGATYHSAKSTRDRDHLRQAILERLGWRIRRIWSTDWFKNPKGELAPIIRELHELKSPPKTFVSEPESEVDEIEEINDGIESEEKKADLFAFGAGSLMEKLIRFDREVIRKELPETPDNKRLLRPAMLEALIEFTPTSKVEFLEMIPSYLRQGTDGSEGKYLKEVFEIINASVNNA